MGATIIGKIFEFVTLITLIIQQQMLEDAKRKESGKLDTIDACITVLKNSRDPEERKNAAIKLQEARKS